MTVRDDTPAREVTVTLRGSDILVNGALVANRSAGLIDGRDDLDRRCRLHHLAHNLYVILDAAYTRARHGGKVGGWDHEQRVSVADGIVAGLFGFDAPHPQAPMDLRMPDEPPRVAKKRHGREYDDGVRLGEALQRVHGLIGEALQSHSGGDAS